MIEDKGLYQIHINLKYIHDCDYCGGYADTPEADTHVCDMVLTGRSETRRMCTDCMIKAFDKVLKRPIYQGDNKFMSVEEIQELNKLKEANSEIHKQS